MVTGQFVAIYYHSEEENCVVWNMKYPPVKENTIILDIVAKNAKKTVQFLCISTSRNTFEPTIRRT